MIGQSMWRARGSALASWSGAVSVLAFVIGCSSSSGDDSAAAGSGGAHAGNGGATSSAGASGSASGGSASGGSATGGAGGASAGSGGSNVGAGGSNAGSAGTAGAASGGSSGSGGSSAGAGGSTNGGSAGAATGGSGGSNAGSGGTATAGAGGSNAGAGGSSAGTGGASSNGGAGGSAAGTGGASGGSAGSGGAAAPDPDGAIVLGSTVTGTIMGTTGDPTDQFVGWDTCPENEVLIGFKYIAFSDFISGLQAVCGKLVVTKTAQLNVTLAAGDTLQSRGGARPATSGAVTCPANSVIIGFSGRYLDRLRKLTFTCAPLILEFQDGATTIGLDLDNKVALAAIGPEDPADDVDFTFSGCPDGQLARGSAVTLSEFGQGIEGWAESLALSCGTPSFTLPNGAACSAFSDCDSKNCDTTCKPFSCDAPTGCTCSSFGGKSYAFCPESTAVPDNASAEAVCETKAMHLAWVPDTATQGWLRFGANAAGATDDAYIGVNDLTTHGTWAQEPSATHTAPAFTDWGAGFGQEPNCLNVTDCGGVIENCVTVRGDGAWNNVDCANAQAFICSN